jgi:bifunctional N-acetylglucosamine-1-phosphate-uridyltransferase/glucosamine-1-phosphate-acetyltransferase GlmU-like protein
VDTLCLYLDRLEERPHRVVKDRGGRSQEIREYFITDLVELMAQDGLEIGYIVARDEIEVMGIDDPESLRKAQEIFKSRVDGPSGENDSLPGVHAKRINPCEKA